MKDFFRFFDKTTFIIIFLLCLFGVALIYSADYSSGQNHYLKQLLWLLVSLVCFFLVINLKVETLFRHSLVLFLAVLVILFIQIVAGRIIAGTRSWLRFGFFQVQVSEFVKIPLALLLAKFLTTFDRIDFKRLFQLLGIVGAPVILIALQPDFGVSFVLCSFFISVLFLKRISIIVLIATIFFAGVGGFIGWNSVLKPYQKARILSFLNPSKYSKTSGYQMIQSQIAIGSGGLSGKGYLKGSQSRYQFLPTRHTDFVVSVLGEELGFIGVSLLFFLFFIFFYRQLQFRFSTDEEFYFIFLFSGLVFFQLLVNIMMAIGLFPVLGITLPFVSYGGSSLLSLFIGEAIIFRIKVNAFLT